MANKFEELEAEVKRLRDELAELTKFNTFIRREAATAAPSAMEQGAIIPTEVGGVSRWYTQTPSGVKYIQFTA